MVPCEFRPVTYAIFTGIVLACLGIILGGQAGIRGKLPNTGIAWTVSGGAAFLVIVMAAVWWATRNECKEFAALKLSFIPTRHAAAAADPSQAVRYMMVRFDERVTVRQFARGDHTDYDIYLSENQTGFKIYLDIIAQDKAVQVCEISLQPAPPSIKSLLAQPDKFIPVGSHTENEPIEVKFKNGFLDELHSSFDARSKGGVNVCIQTDYFDDEGKTRTALVDDVYFVENSVSLADIWTRFGGAAQPARPFRVYARAGAAQPPTLVRERPPEPSLDPPAAVPALAPPSPGAACPERPPQVKAALTTIITTGVVGDDDLKAVYENWCNVEEEFYRLVRIRADSNSIRYNLVRFIRSAVTKLGVQRSVPGAQRRQDRVRAEAQPAPRSGASPAVRDDARPEAGAPRPAAGRQRAGAAGGRSAAAIVSARRV